MTLKIKHLEIASNQNLSIMREANLIYGVKQKDPDEIMDKFVRISWSGEAHAGDIKRRKRLEKSTEKAEKRVRKRLFLNLWKAKLDRLFRKIKIKSDWLIYRSKEEIVP